MSPSCVWRFVFVLGPSCSPYPGIIFIILVQLACIFAFNCIIIINLKYVNFIRHAQCGAIYLILWQLGSSTTAWPREGGLTCPC
uniref:Uncharacterized protein n=1 Tax=Ixodes ricinus TaxID=34613 RepID=A0A6B0UEM3_IXORI